MALFFMLGYKLLLRWVACKRRASSACMTRWGRKPWIMALALGAYSRGCNGQVWRKVGYQRPRQHHPLCAFGCEAWACAVMPSCQGLLTSGDLMVLTFKSLGDNCSGGDIRVPCSTHEGQSMCVITGLPALVEHKPDCARGIWLGSSLIEISIRSGSRTYIFFSCGVVSAVRPPCSYAKATT